MIQGRPKVAVTGATGFIGSNLLPSLTRKGWHVNALVRPLSREKKISIAGVRWIAGDLDTPSALEELVSQCDVVIHCAGVVRGRSRSDFAKVNVKGTENLIDVCCNISSPPCFLLISSLAARSPELSHYALSKRRSEDVLIGTEKTLKWTILRPTAVYGPGDRELMPLFRIMAKGFCPVVGSYGNRFSLLHVHDLVEVIERIVESMTFRCRVYEVHDGHNSGYSWEDIIDTVSRLTGRSIFPIKIPVPIVKMAGWGNIGLSLMTGRAPMLTPGKVNELLYPNWVADNTSIERDVRWCPHVTLEDGLRQLL
jgi:nucleoside-diphosphate-sugar epimerase